MSESKDGENTQPDSQDTFYGKSQGDTQNLDDNQPQSSTQNLNESQDFRLIVDSGEFSDLSMSRRDSGDLKTNGNPQLQSTGVEGMETQAVEGNPNPSDTEKEGKVLSETVKSKVSEDAEAIGEEKMVEGDAEIKQKMELSDDDDEIIEGTPPPPMSPSKRLLSTLLTPGKRKAESIVEPVCKIRRTHSQEDALKLDKNILEAQTENPDSTDKGSDVRQEESDDKESEADILCPDTEALLEEESTETFIPQSDNKRNVIIEESQDIMIDSEPLSQQIVQSSVDSPEKSSNEKDSNKLFHESGQRFQFSSSSESQKSEAGHLNPESDATNDFLEDKSKETLSETSLLKDKSAKIESECSFSTEKIECQKDKGLTEAKNNVSSQKKDLPATKDNSNSGSGSNSTSRSRQSVEFLFDRKSVCKPTELVEIDEEGEKIVLDSSQEDYHLLFSQSSSPLNARNASIYKSSSDTNYKLLSNKDAAEKIGVSTQSEGHLTNGDNTQLRCSQDTDRTASVESDLLEDDSYTVDSSKKPTVRMLHKLTGISEVINISDSEGDNSISKENSRKSMLDSNATNDLAKAKIVPVNIKVGVYAELSFLLHMDETTKEYVSKEVVMVHSELVESSNQRRNSDASACLADVSGNSPGSVTSNVQPFPLNPSRLSLMSTISSSSSASSAASLAAKLAAKDKGHFSLPRGPAKHARKQMTYSTPDKKSDEPYEKLNKEWINLNLISTTIMNTAIPSLQPQEFQNGGDHVEDMEEKIMSSTPESMGDGNNIVSQSSTPRTTKRGRPPMKQNRTKRSNGVARASPEVVSTSQESNSTANGSQMKPDTAEGGAEPEPMIPTNVSVSTPIRVSARPDAGKSLSPQDLPMEELLGKEVFAKWSDNNYYPGTVTEKVKGKYKVNFYDGKSKLLIEDFVIPIPKIMIKGLSVYATTKADDYATCGIIVKAGARACTVETDEGKRIEVEIENIFLTSDQAQVLKEEMTTETRTPQHLGQISLDNLVEGKRRSRRGTTPSISTPKSRKDGTPRKSRIADLAIPSGSGIAKAGTREKTNSESEANTTDSNTSFWEKVEGVQPEILGTPIEQITKGPPSRLKGRGRSKAKQSENPEIVATLGPIPPTNSNIFKNASFLLTCASPEAMDKIHNRIDGSDSEAGTEAEDEWISTPFDRERLKKQLVAGGGTVYEHFHLIQPDEYNNTKLISNVPNLTAKSLLCLSVGIRAYNHKWIINCCRNNELMNPDTFALPSGKSLELQRYVEYRERDSRKPFTAVMVVIPNLPGKNVDKTFVKFWRQICENAGGKVIHIVNTATDFSLGTVVLTDNQCPSWVVEKAEDFHIPLVSTAWIAECLIRGRLCESYDSKYTSIQS